MTKLLAVSALALLVTAACGGKTDDNNNSTGGSAGSGATGATGGSAGSGATGATGGSGATGATGGSGGMPNECSVPTTEPGPYPTKIRFVNPIGSPLFIREDCQLNWSLYSCADGYKTELQHAGDCTVDCKEPSMGCMACGMCMMSAIEVTSTAPAETEWSGYSFTFGETSTGCQCHNQLNTPPGKYAIRVPVFASKDDAESYNAGYDAWGYFDLPAKNGVVEINLAAVAK